jgi:Crinkler effector protein N-terminal domain
VRANMSFDSRYANHHSHLSPIYPSFSPMRYIAFRQCSLITIRLVVKLNCLFFGDDPNQVFSVKIAASESIADLKGLVTHPRLRLYPSDLQIWKVSIPLADLNAYKETYREPKDIPNSQCLKNAFDEISQHWSGELPKRSIHLIVRVLPVKVHDTAEYTSACKYVV